MHKASATSTAGPAILICEDNSARRQLKSCTLARAGFEVLEAASCAEARMAIVSRRPELVLLDIRLPDGDGRELASWVKRNEGTGRPVVLQTSAYLIEAVDRIASLDAGADGYLVEPIEAEELIAIVRALLRLRRAESEREAALVALREADRRKDEFLAMLAHELRNPLAPIRNAAEVLRSDNVELRERARAIIDRQVSHMARLVDDLLEVSRITQRKVMLRREMVTLRVIVDAALETARVFIAARSHTLHVRIPDEPVWLKVDSVRIGQAIANLLNNAAKFTPPGGRIELEATVRGAELVIAVRDNGVGLSDGIRPRIFDLFAQGEQTLARSQGGLGIGLSLARGMVEMHGGTLTADSDGEGRGSTFTLRLPLEQNRGREPRAGASGAPTTLQPRRILLVEDSSDTAESLAVLLECEGHCVRIVHDGLAAVDVAIAVLPEIVLLDIGLPGIDGYEVAAQLRAHDATRNAFIIALTGYGQDRDRARSAQAGCDLHLTKPVEPRHLLNAIESAEIDAERGLSAVAGD